MAITYREDSHIFYLDNKNISYIIAVNEYGYLENIYFGNRISRENGKIKNTRKIRGQSVLVPGAIDRTADSSQFLEEIAVYGEGDYREPSLMCRYQDGSRLTDLKYQSYQIVEKSENILPRTRGGETLKIILADLICGIKVNLYYTVYEDVDAIVRSMEVENASKNIFWLDRAFSFNLDIPNNHFYLFSLCGSHLRERQKINNRLTQGVHKIDSKRGISSLQKNPFIALLEENANENTGEVFAFNLIYSGSFELNAELDENDNIRINGGINCLDFSWMLKSGEKLSTPECAMVYSKKGLGDMSRSYHDLYRNYLISPDFVKKSRPIVLNSWETTYFNFDEKKLFRIIDSLKGTGIDTFVLDDGWFYKRNDDTTSLGDWFADEKKLPHGLEIVSDYCHKNGLSFGLWIEPEMISKESCLYRQHSDWCVRDQKRQPCLGRNQFIIDITNVEVRNYLKNILSNLIQEVA